MASLRRKPNSRYWVACFTDSNGVQRQRSTKETNRSKAQRIAEQFESAYRTKLTEAQARKVLSNIYEEVRGETLFHSTVRTFLSGWLESKRAETAAGTHKRYANAVDKLIRHLGARADQDIAYVEKRDFTELRDRTARDLSPSTANTDLKILRIAMGQSVAAGLRLDNPAKSIKAAKAAKTAGSVKRRPFTTAELTKLLSVATGEWYGIVLSGAYTGQRLRDIASLNWQDIDFENCLITVITSKTGRTVIVPIASSLYTWLTDKHTPTSSGPVFPEAYKMLDRAEGESRRLSAQFHELLVAAELASRRGKKNTGRGHSVQRTVSALSYHSLRHTATSWLKNAGVPEAVVRDIIGHDSPIVSRGYTHVDDATKRRAIKRLPHLGVKTKGGA